jgi:hypothetical protein
MGGKDGSDTGGGYVMPDMWSAEGMLGIDQAIEDWSEGVDAKRHKEPQKSPSSARKSASKNPQVVLRITIKVSKQEAVTTIRELQEFVKGDADFEVPHSSLPIKGLVKWDHGIAGSQVRKWIAVTTEDD